VDPQAFRKWLINNLRRISYRYPARYNTFNKAKIERGRYKCQLCSVVVGRKDLAMDHVEPVVDPATGFVDWNTYIERLFVAEDGWQAICHECHAQKTLAENGQRRASRVGKDKKRP
jgi:5-methylcytosine-specific restriction endonuclease McrA